VLSNNVPYYSLYKLKNIKIEKSDFQTRLSLIDMGVTPRNNWVDAGNLFMYMTGQPIHFFDADKVE
jgi:phenylalanyl-tRNA synthetase beta subunit